MTIRIGYIGLGSLGRHLAGSLLKAGFPLTVHDIDEAPPRSWSRAARPGPTRPRRRRAPRTP
jgi:3-hydroxyisobutyrate dehydrogenase-like beta-hydroxyacid dehydrogenase